MAVGVGVSVRAGLGVPADGGVSVGVAAGVGVGVASPQPHWNKNRAISPIQDFFCPRIMA